MGSFCPSAISILITIFPASVCVQAVKSYDDEKRARLLQFVTGSSRVPLEGFKALQGTNMCLQGGNACRRGYYITCRDSKSFGGGLSRGALVN